MRTFAFAGPSWLWLCTLVAWILLENLATCARLAELVSRDGNASQSTLQLQQGLVSVEGATLDVLAGEQLAVVGQGLGSGLDLRAFGVTASPAFRLLAVDSSLELRNLTLLLPALPPEEVESDGAAAGGVGVLPPSLLAHVIQAVGGSSGSSRPQVVLWGVTLVTGACSDLDTHRRWFCSDLDRWRARAAVHDEPTILGGTVRFGSRAPRGGLMAVGSAAGASGGGSSSDAPPPCAQLLDCTVTCDAGLSDVVNTPYMPSGPDGPWDCVAVTVSDSAGLAVLPDLIAGQLDSNVGTALVTVAAGAPVRVDPGTWTTIKVRVRTSVFFVGRGRAASTLDLAGLPSKQFAEVDSDFSNDGLLGLMDLTLLGLSYPARAQVHMDLMAAWVHAVGISGIQEPNLDEPMLGRIVASQVMVWVKNVRLALPDTEAEWWRNAAPVAADWEAGPVRMQMKLKGLRACDYCWVAPLSRVLLEASAAVAHEDVETSLGGGISSRVEGAALPLPPPPPRLPSTWPLAESLGADVASKVALTRLAVMLGTTITPYVVMASVCSGKPTKGAIGGEDGSSLGSRQQSPKYVMPPPDFDSAFAMFGGGPSYTNRLRRRTGLGVTMLPPARYSFPPAGYSYDDEWLGMANPPVTLKGSVGSCVLLPPPAAQSNPGPATWDMMDLSDRIHMRVGPAGSESDGPSLQIQGFALYNLSPYAQPQPPDPPAPPSAPAQSPSSPQPQQPPEHPTGPPEKRGGDTGPDPFHGLALALPIFQFDRFSPLLYAPAAIEQQQAAPQQQRRLPPLALVNCTLVVPPPELELLRQLLQEAGSLPGSSGTGGQSSSTEAAGPSRQRRARRAILFRDRRGLQQPTAIKSSSSSSSSSSAAEWLWAQPVWPVGMPLAPGPEVPLPPQLLACPRSLLLSYAAVAEVSEASASAISFRRISFLGWSGLDVVVTSQLPDDAPTTLIRSPAELQRPLYSALLEVSCSPPPPQPPSPAPPPAGLNAALGAAGAQPPAPAANAYAGRDGLLPADATVAGGSSAGGTAGGPAAAAAAGSGKDAQSPSLSESLAAAPNASTGTHDSASPAGQQQQQPSWVVPMAAALAAVGGVLLLAGVPLAVVLARRRKGSRARQQQYGQEPGVKCSTEQQLPAEGSGMQAGGHDVGRGLSSGLPNTDMQFTRSRDNTRWAFVDYLFRFTQSSRHIETAAAAKSAPLWHSLDASRLLKSAESVVARSRERGADGLQQASAGSSTSRMLVLSRACRVADAAAAVLQKATSADETPAAMTAGPAFLEGADVASNTGPVAVAGAKPDEELWLECVIGRGGFGVVYLGTWRGLPVAVKTLVVHEALLGEEGRRRQRAVLEAAVSSTLCHPNVVQTYAFDVRRLGELPGVGRGRSTAPALEAVAEEDVEDEGQQPAAHSPEADSVYQLLLIQAYCEGGSLREGVALGNLYMGLAPDSLGGALLGLCLALDVAAGMAHVHARGIVHGDLSSGNVLLSARPPGGPLSAAEDTTGTFVSSAHPHITAAAADVELTAAPAVAAIADQAQAAAAEAAARRLTRDVLLPPVMAKIADFGLSARMGEGQTHASNCWQGTPAYTAPEVDVEGKLGKPADVYSFAVMLLELLSGRLADDGLLSMAALMAAPPEGGSGGVGGGAMLATPGMAAHAAAVLSAAVPTLIPTVCGCNTQLVEMLASCLSPSPQDRPTFNQVVQVISMVIAELDSA
ncbi:hypothetical protein HXX76_010948 [Chlamydomonas incerta]|uniref:Protein kinase domain-containing protein n=1 Tax=Chlamydomonas incerta TaxID=51695 RepID=A0A835SM52_CHLIN|nr:hypothetical protein HXX76_010948 [Chlamydomonas incerta]|eukprot:KAG2423180.1 hypothetical protein HXX76_010948 [Chlamydomonas incerta]